MPLHGRKVATSSSRRATRRTIQAIYDISRDVFESSTPGFVPLPSDVARLTGFLNGLTLQDVGLHLSTPYFRADTQDQRKVTYVHFEDSPKFSFGVFYLPQSAMIPLHDHPGMTVFSKILHGSMHIKSYDWVIDAPTSNQVTRMPNGARLAKLHTDAIFNASSETVVLYPENGGNLHRFTAISPCVVLDVMGPPYTEEEGRDCSYFRSRVAHEGGGDGQYAWLKKVDFTLEMNVHLMDINI
ncbi:hypothetical protein BS78_03G176300 [Paspalum vaginatum]|nr:hypothetical protein BS78_03G176300 [Paspalum vaginatum]